MRTRQKFPTEAQGKALRRIAQAGGSLMLTKSPDKEDSYADLSGKIVSSPTARALIRNGWLAPQRDSMFDLQPQTWKVKTPG